jgi:hypothetical protein
MNLVYLENSFLRDIGNSSTGKVRIFSNSS